MVSGRSITLRARRRLALLALCACAAMTGAAAAPSDSQISVTCAKPLYLTIDTGHMEVAPLIADVLKRQGVKATFFLANERTKTEGGSLDDKWAPWWKARAAEGHAFGSHTWDHGIWRGDLAGNKFRIQATARADGGKVQEWSAAQYCEELQRPASRLKEMTGATMLPLFRAPGGKTSPALLAAAKACGFEHVPWSPAGFLGDELPSDKYPNAMLLAKALREIKAGDILLAHLGIWSRRDPWAPAVLEPLIAGLQEKGFCFQTLREHPQYSAWIAKNQK